MSIDEAAGPQPFGGAGGDTVYTVGRLNREARLLLEFRPIDHQIKAAREEYEAVQQQANRELIRNLCGSTGTTTIEWEAKVENVISAFPAHCTNGSRIKALTS